MEKRRRRMGEERKKKPATWWGSQIYGFVVFFLKKKEKEKKKERSKSDPFLKTRNQFLCKVDIFCACLSETLLIYCSVYLIFVVQR